MSKRARVADGAQRWASSHAEVVTRVAAAGLIVMVGSTLGLSVTPGGVAAAAQPPGAAAADGGFTAEQAVSGWTVYARQCAECHG